MNAKTSKQTALTCWGGRVGGVVGGIVTGEKRKEEVAKTHKCVESRRGERRGAERRAKETGGKERRGRRRTRSAEERREDWR